jgi:carboxypeptidase Taq
MAAGSQPLDLLRARLAELADLSSLTMLADWDRQVMMPRGGAESRAEQLGTLARLAHERSSDERIGEWIEQLEGVELPPLERDLVRLARRDWERVRRVPAELEVESARAAAEGHERWRRARAEDDFAAFAPSLARNVELARERGRCVASDGESPYEGLLGDYDYGLRADDLRRLFGELARELPPLAARAAASGDPAPAVPVQAQRTAVAGVLARVGVDPATWRVDVSDHPFSASMGREDLRVTTRYVDGGVEALLSSMHEYGHALYEHQIDPALDRTNLGRGTSMSIHESQSKLWEDHVARDRGFAEVMAAELGAAGFPIAAPELHAALTAVRPSLVRVSADPLTYPLHIVLRFELELALIEGGLEVGELPEAWREGMGRLLGIEVPSDALGVLQDVHWAGGSFGYFPSYALGCLIAAQLWEALERDLGPREEHLRRAEVGEIRDWLREHVHRHGRRLDTLPLVELASGAPLQTEPFLRFVAPLAEG